MPRTNRSNNLDNYRTLSDSSAGRERFYFCNRKCAGILFLCCLFGAGASIGLYTLSHHHKMAGVKDNAILGVIGAAVVLFVGLVARCGQYRCDQNRPVGRVDIFRGGSGVSLPNMVDHDGSSVGEKTSYRGSSPEKKARSNRSSSRVASINFSTFSGKPGEADHKNDEIEVVVGK